MPALPADPSTGGNFTAQRKTPLPQSCRLVGNTKAFRITSVPSPSRRIFSPDLVERLAVVRSQRRWACASHSPHSHRGPPAPLGLACVVASAVGPALFTGQFPSGPASSSWSGGVLSLPWCRRVDPIIPRALALAPRRCLWPRSRLASRAVAWSTSGSSHVPAHASGHALV